MSGIAGIAQSGMQVRVNRMLDKIAHRGQAGRDVIEVGGVTLGVIWSRAQAASAGDSEQANVVQDRAGEERLARAEVTPQGLVSKRDQLGVAPLYYGRIRDGARCISTWGRTIAGD